MRPLRRAVRTAALAALVITAAPVAAQAPAGWTIRTDGAAGAGHAHGADAAKVKFVVMKPGWHVTTGPAAILYDSTMRARGDWRLEADIHLFEPGGRAEGFGVFFGGSGLAGASQTYGYALVRRDGRAMLKVRDGATTRTVRDWTANTVIPTWKGGPAGTSVKYPLVVEARGDRVSLWVGGTRVLDVPRADLPTDGVVGLRVNHALDLHVEKFAIAPLARR